MFILEIEFLKNKREFLLILIPAFAVFLRVYEKAVIKTIQFLDGKPAIKIVEG